ncbi:MAG: hypothetical protein CHACPFDD_03346 [Phycisphaerae bacterium]|nr:hypothetical protein [Phycisphaerae bacterium]
MNVSAWGGAITTSVLVVVSANAPGFIWPFLVLLPSEVRYIITWPCTVWAFNTFRSYVLTVRPSEFSASIAATSS